jgi:hypothetical protein
MEFGLLAARVTQAPFPGAVQDAGRIIRAMVAKIHIMAGL